MLVWEASGKREAAEVKDEQAEMRHGGPARNETGGRARVGSRERGAYERWREEISGSARRQISREMRVALEYVVAIGCALGTSWLILRLGR